MKSTITISAVQQAFVTDRQTNLEASITRIREASDSGSDLVVLPELHLDPYFCQNEDPGNFNLAESIPGPTTDQLATIARELSVVIVASLFEKRAPGLYHNTAVVLDKDGSVAGIYRKMHIPDDPGYYEKYYFTPGDLGFRPVNTSIGKLGILVCWDQWFPEAARLMALAGAEILIYPTAIGWDPEDSQEEQQRQLQAWITIQCSHAIANGLPVLSCNRIGFEPSPNTDSGIDFWGNSFICGPQGELLAAANQSDAITLASRIDRNNTEKVRNSWPYLRDRRIDDYGNLVKRFID